MRVHTLRFDIWVCLGLGFLLGLGVGKIIERFTTNSYESYVEEHTVQDGDIGGVAGEDTARAESVEDLLANDTFTIVSDGISYMNHGAGYHGSHYFYAVTLPSGERVAAIINQESVTKTGDSIYSGDSILPVGKIVYEDLTKDEYFINQIEYKEPLTRKDFYIDMLGVGGKMNKEDYTSTPKTMAEVITVIISFPIFHTLGAKIGIFPYFFAPKNKKKSDWE